MHSPAGDAGAVEEYLASTPGTGVTYAQLLAERFPGLDPRRFGSVDLVALCERRLAAIVKLTQGKETH